MCVAGQLLSVVLLSVVALAATASSAAGPTVTIREVEVQPPPWASAGWGRTPTLFFGADTTGLESADQMRRVAQNSLVGWGWQQDNANCTGPHSTGACQRFEAQAGERQAAAFAQFLRSSAGNSSAVEASFVYRHSQLALDWYALDRAAVYSAGHDGWFIADASGRRCRENDGGYHWNFSNPAVRTFWVDRVIAEVASEGRTAGIRSVFLDEGDSTYCGYSFATETNCTGLRLPRRVLAQLYRDKLTALRAAAALLNAHGLAPIISLHAHWASPAHCRWA